MKKSKKFELLEFERDVAAEPSDAAALESLKNRPQTDAKGYLDFLSSFPTSTESLRRRKGPTGRKPFTL
jgi:hypothetical protein